MGFRIGCLRRRSSLHRTLLLLPVLLLLGIAIFNVDYRYHSFTVDDGIGSHAEFNEILRALTNRYAPSSSCVRPQLPLLNQFIQLHRPVRMATILCDNMSENWLHVFQSRVHLKPKFAGANCSAEPILRVDDQSSEFGKPQPLEDGSELPSFGFRATCESANAGALKHKSIYYGVRLLPVTQKPREDLDNIIILGVDSISRLESLRSLPNVSELVTSLLRGITMEHYNILGDGTPAALLPILAGVKEEEMPEGRKGFKAAKHLDETMRWIFQDLKEQGYQTLYGEEGNGYGTFQLRFLGFRKEPVDFYLRPVLLQQEFLHKNMICIGNEVSSGRMLQAAKDLFTLYQRHPKFAFLFFAALSHENIDLSPMDTQLSQFLQWFIAQDLIQNTTLIFMSDHGQRNGPMRNSMQGKLEESLPRMSIALSNQLMLRAPSARETLARNSMRLTTPLDIHKTLRSIAGIKNVPAEPNNVKSYSLIDHTVPEDRNCASAGIPAHWCSCLSSAKLPENNHLSLRAASYTVGQINAATEKLRHMCETLSLDKVEESVTSLASEDLAKRQRSVKNDWAVNEVDNSLLASGYVTVRFLTAPSGGLYESTVQFSVILRNATYSLTLASVSEASRINRYGKQADCVTNDFPHLRKFCYCKEEPPRTK